MGPLRPEFFIKVAECFARWWLIAIGNTADVIDRHLVFEFLIARHCIDRIGGQLLPVHGGGVGFATAAVVAGISVQLEKRHTESAAAGRGSEIA